MLQQLLNAEKNGELKLSKKDILQAELPPDLIKKRKWFWWGMVAFMLGWSVFLMIFAYVCPNVCGLSSYWTVTAGALLMWPAMVGLQRWLLTPIDHKCNKYEFDLLCSNHPSYVQDVEYKSDVQLMYQRIDHTTSAIAGDNLLKFLDYKKNVEAILFADALVRSIDKKYRSAIQDFIGNHQRLTLLGIPISFLCLGALTDSLLNACDPGVRAITLFVVIASFFFAPFYLTQHDSYCNNKNKQKVKPYENLRKALNAIIES